MAQLGHVIEIRREPKEVFELLGDPTRDAEWAGPVVAVEALMPGPIGVGSRFRQTSRTLGIRFPMLLEVAEYEPNRRITLKSVAGAVAFRNERRFDPIDTGTRVTFSGNVRLPGAAPRRAARGPLQWRPSRPRPRSRQAASGSNVRVKSLSSRLRAPMATTRARLSRRAGSSPRPRRSARTSLRPDSLAGGEGATRASRGCASFRGT
jgi:uncharacterized protein YndB with AHSA1/START domain